MRPRVGWRNLVSRLKQVVLPAPFGPMSAWIVPRVTRRLTLFTAMKPANSFVRSSVSRIVSLIDAAVPSAAFRATFRKVRPVELERRYAAEGFSAELIARPDGDRPSGPAGPTRRWNGADAPTELRVRSLIFSRLPLLP